MRIGIDYTAAARQRAGIGRYARELITALLAIENAQQEVYQYVIFAATGQLPRARWQHEMDRLRATRNSQFTIRNLPLSDDWVARIWHRLRLPVPVEVITGALDVFYSPDFVLPPTRRATRTLLTVHDFSFLHYPEHFVPKLVQYLNRVVPRSVDRADLVLADSEATRADLIAHLGTPPDRVKVLYGGVDPRFRPEPEPGENERLRTRYGIGDRPYVLSVGTLQPRKNYARLIQSFAQLADPSSALRTGSSPLRLRSGQACRLASPHRRWTGLALPGHPRRSREARRSRAHPGLCGRRGPASPVPQRGALRFPVAVRGFRVPGAGGDGLRRSGRHFERFVAAGSRGRRGAAGGPA